MASRSIIALVALVGLGGVAHAQDVPDAPVADAPAPVEPPPPPAEPPPPPAVEPPTPPTPPPTEHPRDHPRDRPLIIVGLGLGLAGATGTPSDVYGPAFGFAINFGLGVDGLSIEARTGIGFSSLPKQDGLQGSRTRGSFDLRSVIVRHRFVDSESAAVSGFAGIATASVPLLAAGGDQFDAAAVSTTTVTGTGLAFGAAVHLPLARHLELVGELSGYAMRWELPGRAYIEPMPAATDMPNTVTVKTLTDDISSTPWSLTVGLRAEL